MGLLFSKTKKSSRVNETDRAILSLKLQRDQLIQLRRQLEVQEEHAKVLVKKLLSEGKQSLALLALKRTKHQCALVEQAESHLFQLNQLISNVEMASVQNDVVRVLDSGAKALRAIQSEISVNYVEKLLEENAEMAMAVQDVNELLANAKADDESVYNEYRKIEDEIAQDRASQLPSVPVDSDPVLPRQNIQASRELSQEVPA